MADLIDTQNDSSTMMGAGIQTPDLDKKGKPTRTAFRDGRQAYSCWTTLMTDNQVRTSINAELVARHTGKPPHNEKELEAGGQNWRSNFPTLSLMGLEGRISARLISTIDNLRTLTNSYLPESFGSDHEAKSKRYQDRTTSYIRRWKGWRPFISALCSEDVLIGYALAALTDDYNWRPRLFRSDEAFLPQGCGQFPEFIQMAGLKISFMIHEATEWISDGKETAEVAGFEFDNVISSVNKSMPKNPLLDQQGAAGQTRAYQDLIREGNIGTSFTTGAKGVDVAIVLGVEPDTQGVTMYMIDRNNANDTLFFKENRFESMSDVLCMFTLEPGNSSYYGSKGVGRKCVNITTAMDVTANDAVDAYRLSALGVLLSTSKGGIATQIKVNNPFVIVTSDAELQQQRFQFEADQFVMLYGKLGNILENAVGEYIANLPDPNDPRQEKKTATAERIDYQREQEQSVAFIGRFLGQFFDMIGPMQKRMGDPETTDKEAKQYQKELMEIDKLSREEIDYLRTAHTAEVVQDLATQRNQQIDLISQRYGAGTPGGQFVNQLRLAQRDISALSSPQVADDLILPDAVDPTLAAEQVRMQILENTRIETGGSVNVSPRDDDKEHLNVLTGELKSAAPKLMQKPLSDPDLPQLMDNVSAALVHGDAHIAQWKAKGGKPQEIAPFEQFLQGAEKQLQQMGKVLQKFREQQQAQPQLQGPPNGANVSQQQNGQGQAKARESISISYRDAPPSIRRQMESAAGFQPATEESQVSSVDNAAKQIPMTAPPPPTPATPPVAQTP